MWYGEGGSLPSGSCSQKAEGCSPAGITEKSTKAKSQHLLLPGRGPFSVWPLPARGGPDMQSSPSGSQTAPQMERACPEPRDQKGEASGAGRGTSSQEPPDHLPCLGDGSGPNQVQNSTKDQNWNCLSLGVSLCPESEVSQRSGSHIIQSRIEMSARSQSQ